MDQLFLKLGDSKKFKGPMPNDKVVIQQLADGLEYIHSKQLVHGDIRPENVHIFVLPMALLLRWSNGPVSPCSNSWTNSAAAR